ncbi:unnamed protein product [Scytosiphon promiscuus]
MVMLRARGSLVPLVVDAKRFWSPRGEDHTMQSGISEVDSDSPSAVSRSGTSCTYVGCVVRCLSSPCVRTFWEVADVLCTGSRALASSVPWFVLSFVCHLLFTAFRSFE